MKKIFFVLLLSVPVVSQAFFSTTGEIEPVEQSTILSVDGDFLEVTITQKIKGNAEITPIFGLPSGTQSVNFFVDGTGIPLTETSETERLELLFDEAARTGRAEILQLGDPKWGKLFHAEPFTFSETEPVVTKLKYRTKLDFLDDLFYAEIPENAGNLTLVINRNQKIQHFLPICNNEGTTVRTDHQIVWQSRCDTGYGNENFRFFFSEVPAPTLTYKADDVTYMAHLLDEAPLKPYTKIHFIVDQSGSTYGTKWDKTQTVLMEILEKLPASTQIKIDFFDASLKPFNETFTDNSRESQKNLVDYLDKHTPLGKTSYDFLETVWTESDSETLVFLLGDFGNLSIPYTWWKTGPKNPFAVASFEANPDLELWVKTTGGLFLEIFQAPDFIKEATFWSKFDHIFQPLLAQHIAGKFPNQHEFLPYQQTRYAEGISSFFVSRSFDPNETISNATASFLPRVWGERKLGSLLREKLRNGDFSAGGKEAFLAIMNTFGIDLETPVWKDGNLPVPQNFSALIFLENPNVLALKELYTTGLWFVDHRPYKYDGLHHFAYDFFDRVTENNALAVAPFSEAQKQLFLLFPDIVSRPFSIMPEAGSLSFCHHNWRCLSINENGHEAPTFADKLYWRGKTPSHWANQYIIPLAQNNIYDITDEGETFPDEKITRAEFVTMAVEYKYGKTFDRVAEGSTFKDIDDPYLAEVVALLVEKGVIQGYGDQTFRPTRILSRAEAVKVLLTMNETKLSEGYEAPEKKDLPFPDIGGWETFWVITAQAKSMVQGYDNGNFGPHDALTRGQAAKLIIESFK